MDSGTNLPSPQLEPAGMIEINIVNKNQVDNGWFEKMEPHNKHNREVIFQLKENKELRSKHVGSTETAGDQQSQV